LDSQTSVTVRPQGLACHLVKDALADRIDVPGHSDFLATIPHRDVGVLRHQVVMDATTRPINELISARTSTSALCSLAGAYERQVLEELLFFLGGQIVDREGSQPSAASALTAPGRQQVSGLLHQRLVRHGVDLCQAVEHVGRGLLDLSLLELAQVGVRDRIVRGLFDLPQRKSLGHTQIGKKAAELGGLPVGLEALAPGSPSAIRHALQYKSAC